MKLLSILNIKLPQSPLGNWEWWRGGGKKYQRKRWKHKM